MDAAVAEMASPAYEAVTEVNGGLSEEVPQPENKFQKATTAWRGSPICHVWLESALTSQASTCPR